MTSLRRLAVDLLDCEYCGQPKGRNCRTSGGHSLSWPHGARYQPIADTWYAGWLEGQEDVVRGIDSHQPGEANAHSTWWQGYLDRIRKRIQEARDDA